MVADRCRHDEALAAPDRRRAAGVQLQCGAIDGPDGDLDGLRTGLQANADGLLAGGAGPGPHEAAGVALFAAGDLHGFRRAVRPADGQLAGLPRAGCDADFQGQRFACDHVLECAWRGDLEAGAFEAGREEELAGAGGQGWVSAGRGRTGAPRGAGVGRREDQGPDLPALQHFLAPHRSAADLLPGAQALRRQALDQPLAAAARKPVARPHLVGDGCGTVGVVDQQRCQPPGAGAPQRPLHGRQAGRVSTRAVPGGGHQGHGLQGADLVKKLAVDHEVLGRQAHLAEGQLDVEFGAVFRVEQPVAIPAELAAPEEVPSLGHDKGVQVVLGVLGAGEVQRVPRVHGRE